MKEKNKCLICDNSGQTSIPFLNTTTHTLFTNKKISLCEKCGFGQIRPQINTAHLNDYYENYYRCKENEMHIDFNSSELNKTYQDYRSISQLLLGTQYITPKKKYHFLDLGAGLGLSFISAKQILKNVRLFTMENNTDAKNFYKQELDNITIFENFSEIKVKMDIVLMSHSLEHFDATELNNLLQNIYEILEKDGLLIIEVPHADFRDLSYFKNRTNDTPHLSFFSLESLKKLVEKTNFELCFINTAGNLLNDYFSKSQKIKRNKNIPLKKFKKNLFNIIKKRLKYLGFFEFIRETKTKLKVKNAFYENINFKYGDNRDLIRCILKKK
ncbi:class I SAM-dependent methyltransferase [bacterium]|jgi:predicted SAM-dependent methyltransferase|nr:class I SAM-dependent methyltransferase [bacterium]